MSLEDQTLAIVEKKERERFHSAAATMVSYVKSVAPEATGELKANIGTQHEYTSGSSWSVDLVASTPQARYTEEGTGLFGPLGTLITPTVAKALHWIDGGKSVFAMSSKGSGKHKGWFSKAVKKWPDLLGLRG